MNGAGSSYAAEAVWNGTSFGPGVGSGGGISELYPIPSWQQGLDMSVNHGSSSRRNFPDVAAVAENIFAVFGGNPETGWSGTSFAAPLWSAFTALVNQEATANGEPAAGFLNPALYALGRSSNYGNCFHDITTGNNATESNPTQYRAVPGYDLCTGWGSPRGGNLINALALPLRLEITPGPALVFTGSVGGTVNPAMLPFNLTNRSGSLVWIVGQDLPWLNISPTFGSLVAGGPATTVFVAPNLLASNLAVGTYTATLFFTNLSDQTIQTRQVTLEMAGLPVITSQPANVMVSEGMTASFTVSLATNAVLAYQWQLANGSSLTDLVDGGGLSGSATSTLTISNVSLTNAGTYSVIVSNLAGAVSSAGAPLIVLTGQPPVIISQASNQTVLPGAPPPSP
jgi:Immunoglobulin domain